MSTRCLPGPVQSAPVSITAFNPHDHPLKQALSSSPLYGQGNGGSEKSPFPPEHLSQLAVTCLFLYYVIHLYLPCWTKTRVSVSVQHYSPSTMQTFNRCYLLNEGIKPHHLPKAPPAAEWQNGAKNLGSLASQPSHHDHPPCIQSPLCLHIPRERGRDAQER